ncbi:MAG: YaeQ family protein [Oleispira sp.]|nr:YaeQ family protein [Oleispira sp.]
MAIKATVIKLDLTISDMDRDYYQQHTLTMAQHPSETEQRLILRTIAFTLFAREDLQFTKGLSEDSEPDLWQKNLIDDIELWIELGQPDEKRIRKACHKAKQAVILSYGDNAGDMWWKAVEGKAKSFKNLSVYHISTEQYNSLSQLMQRHLVLNASIQDAELWLSDDKYSLHITPKQWL